MQQFSYFFWVFFWLFSTINAKTQMLVDIYNKGVPKNFEFSAVQILYIVSLRDKSLGNTVLRISGTNRLLLCILTREWVLRMPFTGWNQFVNAKITFGILLSHKMYKIVQKITKNLGFSGGLPAFRCYF